MLSPAAACHVVLRLDDVVRGAERATKGYPWLVSGPGWLIGERYAHSGPLFGYCLGAEEATRWVYEGRTAVSKFLEVMPGS
jgi:hypothetical protein